MFTRLQCVTLQKLTTSWNWQIQIINGCAGSGSTPTPNWMCTRFVLLIYSFSFCVFLQLTYCSYFLAQPKPFIEWKRRGFLLAVPQVTTDQWSSGVQRSSSLSDDVWQNRWHSNGWTRTSLWMMLKKVDSVIIRSHYPFLAPISVLARQTTSSRFQKVDDNILINTPIFLTYHAVFRSCSQAWSTCDWFLRMEFVASLCSFYALPTFGRITLPFWCQVQNKKTCLNYSLWKCHYFPVKNGSSVPRSSH